MARGLTQRKISGPSNKEEKMKADANFPRSDLIKKLALLMLILSLCVLPMNVCAGGGSGGADVTPENDDATTAVWVVLMAVLIGGLIYHLNHQDKVVEAEFKRDLKQTDMENGESVAKTEHKDFLTTRGEWIVQHW
jgi:hypothetical protein